MRIHHFVFCTAFFCFTAVFSFAQGNTDIFQKAAQNSIPLLKDVLSIPNDANFHDDIEKNVVWSENQFQKRGFKTQRIPTNTVPLVLAKLPSGIENAKTVLVYLQMDGQPVDPSFWFQDDPYKAELKQRSAEGGWESIDWSSIEKKGIDPEWRVFARSASDAKGPVAMFLTAIDLLKEEGSAPNFNLKVILDFEEEIGSPRLPEAVKLNKEALSSDMLVIFDGPMHLSNKPTLTFGARGITTITLKVFGPYFPQHSGHYGNYIPNPAVRLSQLIASMKDRDGRVTIPGFYDGIEITDDVRKILRSVPDKEEEINYKMGIAEGDKVADGYQESLQFPSLNVRGMLAGWVGKDVRTIIPAVATAEIDVRLVLESDPDRLVSLIRDHIIAEGYHIISGDPTREERMKHSRICQFNYRAAYKAFRTAFDSEIGLWLDRALTKAHGAPPIKQRTSGGSIPISPFVNELGIPAVTVPTVNRDNNQHSPNENLRLGNYIDGIKTMYMILKEDL